MLTILHGDDVAASRTHYIEFKKAHENIVSVSGEAITITDLTQMLTTGSLFDEAKYLAIENLILKKKSLTELKAFAEIISMQAETHTIVLWENKELTKAQLGLFTHATNRIFSLPKSLFLFLDSIRPNNQKELVTLFHKTIQHAEEEMVFFMLVRQMRFLLALSDGEAQIDELKRMSPWQKTKLQKQSKRFTKQKLISLFSKLAAIDRDMKTGKLGMPLLTSIDMFLLSM